ncbi:hypothetical protein SAMN05216516_102102 [Izhakiella capsodis]|uniref:Uncharacterized protein n=1 Tax=Izhakiella capsodis TaxID=1367852 RepID=A0A1I4VV63_9GAMM|nr:hypothetical protein SAMN05216516_102102 [Izhakiella capsodis]
MLGKAHYVVPAGPPSATLKRDADGGPALPTIPGAALNRADRNRAGDS